MGIRGKGERCFSTIWYLQHGMENVRFGSEKNKNKLGMLMVPSLCLPTGTIYSPLNQTPVSAWARTVGHGNKNINVSSLHIAFAPTEAFSTCPVLKVPVLPLHRK